MNASSQEFVTVEMRGLKRALIAKARAERVSLSVLIRRAAERELSSNDAGGSEPTVGTTVKVSIRFTPDEAEQLRSGANRAGLPHGAYIIGLLHRVPAISDAAAGRLECLAALTASCAELATLARHIGQLTALLRHGDVLGDLEHRTLLDSIGVEVREHLRLAARALADLRPPRSVVKAEG